MRSKVHEILRVEMEKEQSIYELTPQEYLSKIKEYGRG
jgi:hypothetical protein